MYGFNDVGLIAVVGRTTGITHCANKSLLPSLLREAPGANLVPVPSAAVFQPANTNPDRANVPTLATVPPVLVMICGEGATPEVCLLPSYEI